MTNNDSVTAIDGPASSTGLGKRDEFDEKRNTTYIPNSPVPQHKSFFTTPDPRLVDRPFFVAIGEGGVLQALHKLDEQLKQSGRSHILSKKVSVCFSSSLWRSTLLSSRRTG